MKRISIQMLDNSTAALNQLTKSPLEYRTDKKTNIGHFHISQAYGGVCLHRTMNEAGGVEDVFRCGHVPKRELWNRIQSLFIGLDIKS